MVFGTCCIAINGWIKSMNTKSVKIEGVQRGLLVNFEVTQTFYHEEKEFTEVSYFFPTDLKICIYDTTFVVGDEIIKPKLQSKKEANKTYQEAVNSGRTAIFGTNIDHGMTEFKLGNVQPGTECKVILKLAFTGQITKENTFFVKFPIDVCTPSGSCGCLDVNSSQFSFKLQTDPEKVTKVTSNVKNANFDEVTKLFSINDKIENSINENSIIITFTTKEARQSSCFISPTDSVNFDCCVISVSPNLPASEETNSEFVFLVDCSASMRNKSIKKASECLEFFIKSLPPYSYFNVVRFGSSYEKLFETSVLYNDETSEKAVNLAQKLSANLGGTCIYEPLKNIYSEKCQHGQRQVFIMTDGEVDDVESVLELVSSNSNESRCFTIGIGRGCDAGLVEGMAKASGGISDFVQEGDSIIEKVISQLQSSLYPSVTSLEIHIEGQNNDSFEVSPYPLPSVNANGSTVIYLRQKKIENAFDGGILVTGNYGSQSVEIPIVDVQRLDNVEEDRFGCSGGKNIGKAILPLFAFSSLQRLDRKRNISEQDKMKAIELSISSGVLCKYTGYVGLTEQPVTEQRTNTCFKQQCRFSGNSNISVTYPKAMPLHLQANRCNAAAAPQPLTCSNSIRVIPHRDLQVNRCNAAVDPPTLTCGTSIRLMPHRDPQVMCCNASVPQEVMCCNANAPPPPMFSLDSIQAVSSQDPPSAAFVPPKVSHAGVYPTKYELISITRYQKAGGFWDNLDAVKSIAGVSIEKIDGVSLPDKDTERRCVATIIAIAVMRAKSSDEKNLWAMIEQKALAWLKKALPNVDVENVISKVQSSI